MQASTTLLRLYGRITGTHVCESFTPWATCLDIETGEMIRADFQQSPIRLTFRPTRERRACVACGKTQVRRLKLSPATFSCG